MIMTVTPADVSILENLHAALINARSLVDAASEALNRQKTQKTHLSLSPRQPKSDKKEGILLEQLKFEFESRARWEEHRVCHHFLEVCLDELARTLTALESSRLEARQFLASDRKSAWKTDSKIRVLAEEAAVLIPRAATQVLNGYQYLRGSESSGPQKSWPGSREAHPFVFAQLADIHAPRNLTIRLMELDDPVDHSYNYITALAPYQQDGLFFQSPSINKELPCLTLEEASNIWLLMKLAYEPRRFDLFKPTIVNLKTDEVVEPALDYVKTW